MVSLTQMSPTQEFKYVTFNDVARALAPSGLFGERTAGITGRTFAFYGGRVWANGAEHTIADGTLLLTASSTCYIELDLEASGGAPSISFNTSGFTVGRHRLFTVTTDGSSITGIVDHRQFAFRDRQGDDVQAVDYAAAIDTDVLAGELVVVGALTGNVTVNAPSNPFLGARLTYLFTQDGTGSRVVTWNAAFRTPTDAGGSADETGGVTFRYNGSAWVQIGAPLEWH